MRGFPVPGARARRAGGGNFKKDSCTNLLQALVHLYYTITVNGTCNNTYLHGTSLAFTVIV